MSRNNTPREENDSQMLKNKLYWKGSKLHRCLKSVEFLEECSKWKLSPKFCRLTKNTIHKNGMEFNTVKRIEMNNLKREFGYQRSRAQKLSREKEEILIQLKGKLSSKVFSSVTSQIDRDISEAQRDSDARRSAKLRKLKQSIPLNHDQFNKVQILNHTGVPIPMEIVSLLQYGPDRSIGSSKFDTKTSIEFDKLYRSFAEHARQSGVDEEIIATIQAHCILSRQNLKTCLTEDPRTKVLTDFLKVNPQIRLLRVDKSKDVIFLPTALYHQKLENLFEDR